MILKTEIDYMDPIAGDPPPYVEIELESIERRQQPVTMTSSPQFCRFAFDGTRDQSSSLDDETDMVSCCPGFQEVQAGGQQIVNSGLLFTETSLIAAGGAIQGLGRIVAGLGKAIAYHRA